MKYDVIFIENPPKDFEPKYFESEALIEGKRGSLILNEDIKFVVKKANYLLISSAIILLLTISFTIRVFSPLSPIMIILFIVSCILLAFPLIRTKKEEMIIKYDEINSLDIFEYEAGLLKTKRFVINIKTNTKNIWIQSRKRDEEIFNALKSKCSL
jgi:hypothetical protein